MRVAAVDLGTNATRLLVADVEDGRLDEVERESACHASSARESTHAGGCCRCRSRACGTASRTTAARSSRSAPSGRSPSRRARSATRERRGLPRRGRVELRLHDPARCPETRRPQLPSAASTTGGRSTPTLIVDIGGGSTELRARDRGRRLPRQPRPRLRADNRALPGLRPADAARSWTTASAAVRSLLADASGVTPRDARRSASPER